MGCRRDVSTCVATRSTGQVAIDEEVTGYGREGRMTLRMRVVGSRSNVSTRVELIEAMLLE